MPDAIQTDLPRLTPSSVQDLECPAKYKALRMGRDRDWGVNVWETSAQVAHGSACHDVLRQLIRTREGDEPGLTHLDAFARQSVYKARYPAGTDREEAAERVKTTVLIYLRHDQDVGNTISVERPIEFDYKYQGTGLFRASVKIDRLIYRPDQPKKLILRDYKFTTSPRIALPEAFLYLWAAKKMFAPDGYEEFELEYDFVDPDNRVSREVVTGRHVRGQYPLIVEAAVRVIRGTEWPACPGDQCTYCPRRGRTCMACVPEG